MPFLTSRQRGLAGVVAALVAVAAITALADYVGWSIAALAALLGATCALLLDIRHRQQVAARSQRRLEEAVAELAGNVIEDVRERRDVNQQDAATLAELLDTVRTEARTAEERHSTMSRQLARLDYEPVNEVQALLQLLPKVGADTPPLPGLGGWALSASALLAIWNVVEREQPATIVECGSGTSTLWLGYAARAVGDVRVIALEHKAAFAKQTADLLAEHGLQDIAHVRHAPLKEADVGGDSMRWYDLSYLSDVDAIDLLVVDGPTKSIGAMARYPAVPVLKDKLSAGAYVVLDDVNRPDEAEAMRLWRERFGLRRERHLGRDTVLLRFPSPE